MRQKSDTENENNMGFLIGAAIAQDLSYRQ